MCLQGARFRTTSPRSIFGHGDSGMSDTRLDTSIGPAGPADSGSTRDVPGMFTLARSIVAVQLACFALAGCEDEPPPPPNKEETNKQFPEIDERFSATIHADRQIRLTNLAFVLQRDPMDPKSLGVSLTTTRPGADGSRLIFGTFVRGSSIATVAKSKIYLSAGPLFNPHGSGIFTGLAAYQPKFAALTITAFDEGEVRGTFSGDFYRFSMVRPSMQPKIIEVNATFVAALITK